MKKDGTLTGDIGSTTNSDETARKEDSKNPLSLLIGLQTGFNRSQTEFKRTPLRRRHSYEAKSTQTDFSKEHSPELNANQEDSNAITIKNKRKFNKFLKSFCDRRDILFLEKNINITEINSLVKKSGYFIIQEYSEGRETKYKLHYPTNERVNTKELARPTKLEFIDDEQDKEKIIFLVIENNKFLESACSEDRFVQAINALLEEGTPYFLLKSKTLLALLEQFDYFYDPTETPAGDERLEFYKRLVEIDKSEKIDAIESIINKYINSIKQLSPKKIVRRLAFLSDIEKILRVTNLLSPLSPEHETIADKLRRTAEEFSSQEYIKLINKLIELETFNSQIIEENIKKIENARLDRPKKTAEPTPPSHSIETSNNKSNSLSDISEIFSIYKKCRGAIEETPAPLLKKEISDLLKKHGAEADALKKKIEKSMNHFLISLNRENYAGNTYKTDINDFLTLLLSNKIDPAVRDIYHDIIISVNKAGKYIYPDYHVELLEKLHNISDNPELVALCKKYQKSSFEEKKIKKSQSHIINIKLIDILDKYYLLDNTLSDKKEDIQGKLKCNFDRILNSLNGTTNQIKKDTIVKLLSHNLDEKKISAQFPNIITTIINLFPDHEAEKETWKSEAFNFSLILLEEKYIDSPEKIALYFHLLKIELEETIAKTKTEKNTDSNLRYEEFLLEHINLINESYQSLDKNISNFLSSLSEFKKEKETNHVHNYYEKYNGTEGTTYYDDKNFIFQFHELIKLPKILRNKIFKILHKKARGFNEKEQFKNQILNYFSYKNSNGALEKIPNKITKEINSFIGFYKKVMRSFDQDDETLIDLLNKIFQNYYTELNASEKENQTTEINTAYWTPLLFEALRSLALNKTALPTKRGMACTLTQQKLIEILKEEKPLKIIGKILSEPGFKDNIDFVRCVKEVLGKETADIFNSLYKKFKEQNTTKITQSGLKKMVDFSITLRPDKPKSNLPTETSDRIKINPKKIIQGFVGHYYDILYDVDSTKPKHISDQEDERLASLLNKLCKNFYRTPTDTDKENNIKEKTKPNYWTLILFELLALKEIKQKIASKENLIRLLDEKDSFTIVEKILSNSALTIDLTSSLYNYIKSDIKAKNPKLFKQLEKLVVRDKENKVKASDLQKIICLSTGGFISKVLNDSSKETSKKIQNQLITFIDLYLSEINIPNEPLIIDSSDSNQENQDNYMTRELDKEKIKTDNWALVLFDLLTTLKNKTGSTNELVSCLIPFLKEENKISASLIGIKNLNKDIQQHIDEINKDPLKIIQIVLKDPLKNIGNILSDPTLYLPLNEITKHIETALGQEKAVFFKKLTCLLDRNEKNKVKAIELKRVIDLSCTFKNIASLDNITNDRISKLYNLLISICHYDSANESLDTSKRLDIIEIFNDYLDNPKELESLLKKIKAAMDYLSVYNQSKDKSNDFNILQNNLIPSFDDLIDVFRSYNLQNPSKDPTVPKRRELVDLCLNKMIKNVIDKSFSISKTDYKLIKANSEENFSGAPAINTTKNNSTIQTENSAKIIPSNTAQAKEPISIGTLPKLVHVSNNDTLIIDNGLSNQFNEPKTALTRTQGALIRRKLIQSYCEMGKKISRESANQHSIPMHYNFVAEELFNCFKTNLENYKALMDMLINNNDKLSELRESSDKLAFYLDEYLKIYLNKILRYDQTLFQTEREERKFPFHKSDFERRRTFKKTEEFMVKMNDIIEVLERIYEPLNEIQHAISTKRSEEVTALLKNLPTKIKSIHVSKILPDRKAYKSLHTVTVWCIYKVFDDIYKLFTGKRLSFFKTLKKTHTKNAMEHFKNSIFSAKEQLKNRAQELLNGSDARSIIPRTPK